MGGSGVDRPERQVCHGTARLCSPAGLLCDGTREREGVCRGGSACPEGTGPETAARRVLVQVEFETKNSGNENRHNLLLVVRKEDGTGKCSVKNLYAG